MRGKAVKFHVAIASFRDHPRLCGEKVDSTFSLLIVRGSPPPMRGKVLWYRDFCPAVGITPAYAGKSRKWTEIQLHTWDHPRLCGEKANRDFKRRCKTGSPPPMRGKVLVPVRENVQYRITPAYAGKSSVADKTFTPQRDQCH